MSKGKFILTMVYGGLVMGLFAFLTVLLGKGEVIPSFVFFFGTVALFLLIGILGVTVEPFADRIQASTGSHQELSVKNLLAVAAVFVVAVTGIVAHVRGAPWYIWVPAPAIGLIIIVLTQPRGDS